MIVRYLNYAILLHCRNHTSQNRFLPFLWWRRRHIPHLYAHYYTQVDQRKAWRKLSCSPPPVPSQRWLYWKTSRLFPNRCFSGDLPSSPQGGKSREALLWKLRAPGGSLLIVAERKRLDSGRFSHRCMEGDLSSCSLGTSRDRKSVV